MSATLGRTAALFIATLIAEDLRPGDLSMAADRLAGAGCAPGAAVWIEPGIAADVPFAVDPATARATLEGSFAGDVVVQARATRAKALLVADMDSTMITVECIDELADYAGLKLEVSAVTAAAMRGELDFAAALDARVALLAGMAERVLAECLRERVKIMAGALALVRTMRARGGRAVLVSGGFTAFADPVARAIGFNRAIANVLMVENGRLTGAVARPIVGAAAKREALERALRGHGVRRAHSLAVGDGANDLEMIRAAGLGVAYHAKPVVAAAADARIERGDLSALLYAQGLGRDDWSADV